MKDDIVAEAVSNNDIEIDDDLDSLEESLDNKKSEVKELYDWLEFKCPNGCFVNLNRLEIEYVIEDENNKEHTEIGMKSGNKIVIAEKYDKIMEMV